MEMLSSRSDQAAEQSGIDWWKNCDFDENGKNEGQFARYLALLKRPKIGGRGQEFAAENPRMPSMVDGGALYQHFDEQSQLLARR